MNVRYYLLPLIILMFFCLSISAQPLKKFSADPIKFQEELKEMFDQAQSPVQKTSGKQIMTDFNTMWNNGEFSQMIKDSVYSMCNRMLSRKMKTFPHFEQYLTAAIRFARSDQSSESFGLWCYGLGRLAAMSNSLRFMTFIEATNALLADNTLYRSNILYWQASDNSFFFAYDSLPCIKFDSPVDIACYKKGDSSIIYGTTGVFYPTSDTWIGKGGKIFWERAGFPIDEVWAEIDTYSLGTNKTEFTIDTVTFYNKNFFQRPLFGSLVEKVVVDVSEERVSYPRFTSFDKRLQIKNLFKDIDYDGGFAQYGPKLMGEGDVEQDAWLVIKRENKPFIRIGSKSFVIRPEGVSAGEASVAIYWEEDSIYHPGLNMKYNNDIREVNLTRGKTGISQSPYFDTYHKIDMYFEALYWKMDSPIIDLQMIKGANSEASAYFESDDYYSEFRYDKLRGMEDIHPLLVLRDISVEKGSKTFTVADVQKKMKVAKEQIQGLLISFAVKGFIVYDVQHDLVTLKDRVLHYINAKNGKTDYDIIQFNSTIAAQSNATLSLLNFDLKLRGVPLVYISDSQNVYIIPYEQELILKKNRDFLFDGLVRVGLFEYSVKNCYFNYDQFKLDMPDIDSMNFKVQDRSQPADNFGHHPLVRVRTAIEDISGEILIDLINNKSGLKPAPVYPIFNSKKESYVYYDKPFIFNGVYSRDRFYFRLQPFTIDSVDSYYSERKEFNGYLVSGGIFPDITQPITVQPDFSLGFVIETPEGGLPAYGGKGRYDSIIDLSYKGLRGKGTLKYLTSTTHSQDYYFFPDSMWARSADFTIAEKKSATEYPPVKVRGAYVHWIPYADRMWVEELMEPFDMYNGWAKHSGNLTLEPTGLSGDGILAFGKVEMISDKIDFFHHTLKSDTTDVKFRTDDLKDIVLGTENYNAFLDFDKKIGTFLSNDEDSKITFPFNQYVCYMYNFIWHMDDNVLDFVSTLKEKYDYLKFAPKDDIIESELTDSRFISTHPAQDSLNFYAPIASYSLMENVIFTKDVPVILVADAAIFPDSGKVTIYKKGEIDRLENAQIIANTDSKFHLIYNASVNILGAKKYSGSGIIDYKDVTETIQSIYLSSIKVDTAGQTIGVGDVAEAADFTLSPYFGFKGNVRLEADKEFLNFDGGARIKHDCDTLSRRWLRFTADINPGDVMIPVDDKPHEFIIGGGGDNLGMGLYLGDDTSLVYQAFVQAKNKYSDANAISATGFLSFNKGSGEYIVQPVVDSSVRFLPAANVVRFDQKNCVTYGSGRINLETNLGQVNMESFGNIKYSGIDRNTDVDIVLLLEFFFNDDAMKLLVQGMESETGSEGVNTSDDKFVDAIKFMVGPEKTDELINQTNLIGRMKDFPKELSKWTFLIADIKLKWNPATRSFVNDGKMGIASAGSTQLYKYVTGYVEIGRKRSGNILTLYIETNGEWYYFSYQNNKMQAYSSLTGFNDAIKKAMGDDKNGMKTGAGEVPYVYILATENRKNEFLKKVKGENEEDD